MRWKIVVCVVLAVLLQTVLREAWEPLKFVELPLVVVAYLALRRDAVQAMFISAVTGLAIDFLSRGLKGANGFTYTLVAFLIATLATRVMLDNPFVRIPVLAGATALHVAVYVLLHRMLGQTLRLSFAEFAAYTLIATTVVGTFLFLLFDGFFSEQTSQRRHFAFRRRAARRSLVRRL